MAGRPAGAGLRVRDLRQPPVTSVELWTLLQKDFEETRQRLDGQQQALTGASADAAKQAAQLRGLEHSARKWAKKFLHKVKTAAAVAERTAGLPIGAVTASPSAHGGSTQRGQAAAPLAGTQASVDTLARLQAARAVAVPSSPSEPPSSSPAQRGNTMMDSLASEEPRHMDDLRETAESMRAAGGGGGALYGRATNGRNGSAPSDVGNPDAFGTFDTRASDDMRTFGDLGASSGLSGRRKGRTILNRLFSHGHKRATNER